MSVTYDAHVDWLVKMEMGARAERMGFVDAKAILAGLADEMVCCSDYEQMRYRQGLENGTAMLTMPLITITPLMIAALLEEGGR